ncbi:hypothetical protein [Streptomyces sp. NBC_01092]|uniref:AraC-like ligand-binding domain-containing protein n=1 Tax=Streptomyces sp. NBC_01092 TaxID=2903748 RepID=UPI00386C2AB4
MAATLDAPEQAERLKQLASAAFAPLRILLGETTRVPGADSTLRRTKPGEVLVTKITGSPCTVLRDRSLIGSDDRDLVKVALCGRGCAGVEQDGRQCLPGPGDLVVYETTRPYELHLWVPFGVVVLDMPRALLGPHTELTRSPYGVAGPAAAGSWRRHCCRRRRAIWRRAAAVEARTWPTFWPRSCYRPGRAACSPPPHGQLRRAHFHLLPRPAIRPQLSPESVATAHHVSVLYQQQVPQQRGGDTRVLDPQPLAGTDPA